MLTTMESRKPMLNRVIWGSIFLVIVAGIGGYYYFAKSSLLIKFLGVLSIAVVCVFLAALTTQGRNFWQYWLEAIAEVRRMYWPTRKETMQTTLIVVVMVFVLGILLWTADFLLLRAVGWLTGHWGG